jgi:ABC-type iron transport system FetAB ATPase subunit
MSLLGEVTKLEGELILTKNSHKGDGNSFMHCLSYVAQSPWLLHLSIKDNVIFGSPLNEERHGQTVNVCDLRADLDILEDSGATEIRVSVCLVDKKPSMAHPARFVMLDC